jgi:hypothetical protein
MKVRHLAGHSPGNVATQPRAPLAGHSGRREARRDAQDVNSRVRPAVALATPSAGDTGPAPTDAHLVDDPVRHLRDNAPQAGRDDERRMARESPQGREIQVAEQRAREHAHAIKVDEDR